MLDARNEQRAPQRPQRAPSKRWSRAWLSVCLSISASVWCCAGAQARRPEVISWGTAAQTPAARTCPAGTFDYGDGMVASMLPESTLDALVTSRRLAVAAAGPRQSNLFPTEQWRPHVSIIYGVTEDREVPAYEALSAFVGQRPQPVSACLGGLTYWDDPKGTKTTVVLAVEEPQGAFAALHNVLAEAAHIESRFAYHPHVTVIFLEHGMRFSAAQEAAILAPLEGMCWPGGGYFVTNRCGQVLHQVSGQ